MSVPSAIDNTWAPRLREELVWAQAQGDKGGALWDPVVNRRVNLGVIARALVLGLDGTRGLADVISAVADAHPDRPRALIEHTFRTLMLMNLVEGSGKAILERVFAVRMGRVPFPTLVLEGSRFGCQGSGECCQNYTFGPLSDEDAARLESLDLATHFPNVKPPYIVTVEREGHEPVRNLASVNDRCVFLSEERLCGLHRVFGAESKPHFCRLFPLQPLPTIDGLKLYDRGECASFATSARDGQLILDQAPAIADLMPKSFDLLHPIVLVDDETPCDYGHFLALQRVMVALVEARIGTAAETLAALGRLMGRFLSTLRACPLLRGEPDASLGALLALPPSAFYEPPSSITADDWDTLSCVARDLLKLVGPSVRHEVAALLPVLTTRLSSEFGAAIHLIQALAALRSRGEPLPDEYRRVVELPCDPALLEDVLRLSYRQRLFGHQALIDERPLPALLRLAFVHLITALGARLRARIEGAPAVEERHLSFAHMLALRVMRREGAGQVLAAYQPDTFTLLDAASQLL